MQFVIFSKKIIACGTIDFVTEYLKDTAVFAAFSCGGQRVGFYLKKQITDGTYLQRSLFIIRNDN